MRKNYSVLMSVVTFTIILFSNVCFSQTLELGSLSSFVAYSVAGAVTNSGEVTGDAGSNSGVISGSGFGSDYTGTIYENDSVTAEAKIDLLRVYIHLSDVLVTHRGTHAAAFGNGETITPGVYALPGAGSVEGDLILDGGGDPNAYFIIKFNGALTIGASANIILTGGLEAANVFWIAEGAIVVSANAVVKGTLFSHPGAISLGVNVSVEGRMLSSEGAITIAGGSVVTGPTGDINIPINCLSNCTPSSAVDVLGSLSQFAFFTNAGAVTNTGSSGIVGNVGTNSGTVSGFATSIHVGFISTVDDVTAQAKIELDSAYIKLMALPNDSAHAAAFGSGETVYAGVYHITGAGSLSGTITLDAQGDPDAIFVFRFGGAFSVAAQSTVIFTNGTRRCNVFWVGGAGVATGAVSIGTFTFMKGTVISHGGACSMAAGGNLEGRLLSTGGAIGFSIGLGYNDPLCFQNSIVTSEDQTECLEEFPTLTATATASSTNQNIVWYDAEVGGNVVDSPTQVGVGSVVFYAASFNGVYYSDTRSVSTLTIADCSLVLDAIDDSYTPIQVADEATYVGDVTANDTLDGDNVTDDNTDVTAITTEALSVDGNGELTLNANTLSGTYSITYQLCQVGSNLSNCSSATVTVVVVVIDAVEEVTEPVNGIIGGETTPLISNDTLSDELVVIGTAPENVTLTEVVIPLGFTLNPDGTVTIPPNTPAGDYNVEYQICEVSNPENRDSAISIVVVSAIGCKDQAACNYHPDALIDDGSCIYTDECGENGVAGCADSNACNYDSLATCDDFSCLSLDECGECGGTGTLGCTEPSACNYDPSAACDGDSCTFASNVYYADADNDLFGDEFLSITECGDAPAGYVMDNTDCDDTNNRIYPGAPATGEGYDNDCNGTISPDEEGSCSGDFDFDGIINVEDLLIFLTDVGCQSACFCDLNGDDMTNTSDILIFLGMFGSHCP